MGTRTTVGTTKAKGIQKALCWMMAVVMAVSLMPLPAYAAQSDGSLTGGSALGIIDGNATSLHDVSVQAGGTWAGSGTESDPYLIEDREDLDKLATDVDGGEGYSGKYFKLTTSSIVLDKSWNPIGDGTTSYNNKTVFQGTFDGAGNTITFDIKPDDPYVDASFGVFHFTNGATIKNLVTKGAIYSSNTHVAAVAARAGNTSFVNVGNEATIISTSSSTSGTYVAGIMAVADTIVDASTMTSCYNKGDISCPKNYIAGLVGNTGTKSCVMTSCYNSGTVTSTNASATYVGGLVGGGTPKVLNSYNWGNIVVQDAADTYVNSGAISGYSTKPNTSFVPNSATDQSYYCSTSVQNGATPEKRGKAGAEANQATYYIAKSTDEMKALETLLNVEGSDYAGRWVSGETINASFGGAPALAWEKQRSAATLTATIDGKDSATLAHPATKNIAVSYTGDSAVPAISAVSSDDTVVTVGAYNPSAKTIPVTSVGSGTATITVTAAETDDYSSASAAVAITVTGGPVRYEVTFATDGGSAVATQSVNSGSVVKKPGDPTKAEYVFDGWYIDKDASGTFTEGDIAFDFKTTVTTALSLVAKWVKPVEAQITVTPTGGTYTFIDTDTGETISPFSKASFYWYKNLNPNHLFKMTGKADGYKDGEKTFDFTGKTGVISSLSFTLEGMDYSITYKNLKGADDSSFVKTYKYKFATVTLPDALEAEGYTFNGWYVDEAYQGSPVTKVTTSDSGDKVFYAKWTPVEYNITYVLDEGTNSETNPTSYTIETPTITLANPTRDAYYFRGWTADGITKPVRNLQIQQGSIGDKEFTANWVLESEITLANITYNAIEDVVWDGAAAESQYVEGEGYQLPSNLTRAGYAFKGWYDNEACAGDAVTEIPASATGAKEFWAKWVPTYTITWKNGGEVIETDEEVEYGSTPSFDGATPTQAEDDTNTYVFIGWDPEPAEVTGDATYVAKFDTVSKQSKTALGNVIATAQKTLAAATTTAESASAVAEGTHYVTAAQKQALQTAIAAAQATADNANATQAEVNKATQDLTSAITAFESAQEKQVGTKKAAATTTPTSTTQPTTPANTGNSTDKTATAGNTTATDKAGTTTTDNASKSSDSASTTKTDTSTTTKTATTTKTTTTTKAAKNVKASSGSAKVTVDISSNGTATIKAGKTTGKTVSINTVTMADGKVVKVTAIAANAFKGTSATKVTIGSNVKTIGAGAFANAKKLTTVTVGKNVKSIGKNAFKGAKKLKTVAIGKSVKSVGANAFKGCKKLKTLKISSTKLTKKACKNMLKGSSVKTIKLTGMSKAAKKKALKNYKKWFPKKVAGKKLVIK